MGSWLTLPPRPNREPGLTSADMEEGIHKAMVEMPQPDAGLS